MAWKEIGGIKSSSSARRSYSIDANEDGELRCSCPAFIHSTAPKWCKHTESSQAQDMLRKHLERNRPAPRVPCIVRGANVYWGGANRHPVALVSESNVLWLDQVLDELERSVRLGFLTQNLRDAYRSRMA